MTTGDPSRTTEAARESAAYVQHIRRTNERLALAVAGLFAVTAILPITLPEHRVGVLWAAATLFIFTLAWFHLLPPTALGDRRVVIFAVLVQPVVILLMAFTGGNSSPYFAYFLLPVLVTIYSPRTRHTLAIGAVSAVSLIAVALLARGAESLLSVVERLATQLLQLVVYILFTAVAGRALRDARRAITARAEELAGERSSAMKMAFTDTLTGLYNRRYAEDLLTRLVAEAARGRPFSVLALDLDGLKRINDSLGHPGGDRVIARIADVLRLQLRGADVPIRVGGDEFLALLPSTSEAQAKAVGERLRIAVRDDDWSSIGLSVTISVGAAEWRSGQSGDDVVKTADTRLYESKRTRASR